MDFDVSKWFDVFQRNPVLIVALGGLLIGIAFTQAVKKTWLAFGNINAISIDRYQVSCMWLAILSSFFATHMLWSAFIREDAYGMNRAVSLLVSIPAPLTYKLIKAVVAWKFPSFAKLWGDDSI